MGNLDLRIGKLFGYKSLILLRQLFSIAGNWLVEPTGCAALLLLETPHSRVIKKSKTLHATKKEAAAIKRWPKQLWLAGLRLGSGNAGASLHADRQPDHVWPPLQPGFPTSCSALLSSGQALSAPPGTRCKLATPDGIAISGLSQPFVF